MDMAAIVQWQNAALWQRMSWVRPPLAAPIYYQQLMDSFRFWRAMVAMMGPSFVGKIMALEFYSRHRKECEAERRKDFRSGQFEECPVVVSSAPASSTLRV